MQRYELAPERRMLVKCDDGPWVFYADVERLKEQLAEARELLQWRTDLPKNLDECMEIAVPLRVGLGWYRCIGYVLQDMTITDFDHEHVGYDWDEGAVWRPVIDPDMAPAGEE